MIQRKILIVDDELVGRSGDDVPAAPRDKTYLDLIEHLDQIAPSQFRYTPILCSTEEEVLQELNENNHSSGELISIVDLVLSEKGRFSDSGITELLELVLKSSRLTFFTTRRLDEAKISTLIKFQKANRCAGLFPFELIQRQPKEFARLLHRAMVSYDEGKVVDHIEYLKKKEISDLNILFLSDFHFKEDDISLATTDLQNLFQKLEDLINDRRLDMVFLLGDYTDKGKVRGFSTAQNFLEELKKLANFPDFPNDFIRLVPGNHDVVSPLSLSGNISRGDSGYQLEEATVDSDLLKYGIQPFHHFRDKISQGLQFFGADEQCIIRSNRHWIDARWLPFGIIFVGFDSNSTPKYSESVKGSIDDEDLFEFRNTVAKLPRELRKNLLMVVLAHHYTGDGGGDRGIAERDNLKKHCSELDLRGLVFVNGDRHGDPIPQLGRQLPNDGTTPLELAVPTFCQKNAARQEGASRGAVLVNFKQSQDTITKATVHSFSFNEGGAITTSQARGYRLQRNGWSKANRG